MAGRRPRAWRRTLTATVVVTGLAVASLVTAGPASAYWSASATPDSAGAATLATVNPGETPTAAADARDLTVSWSASTLSDSSTPVTSYTINRYAAGSSTPVTVGGSCAGQVTTFICVETGVPEGSWQYTVTPRIGTKWLGVASPKSTVVVSDATPPVNVLSLNSTSGGSFLSGTTIYYRGSAPGSFAIANAVTDTGSGSKDSATGALTGTTAGWSNIPTTVATPAGGPYVSSPFTWSARTTSSPSVAVTSHDNAGNFGNTTVTFVNDSAGPTGGSVSYPNGLTTSRTVTVTTSPGTDAGSGIASQTLQRRSAPLRGSICGTFGSWTTAGSNTDTTLAFSTCYQYQLVVSDNVGNQATFTSTATVQVQSPYQASILSTPGLLSYWRFDGAPGSTLIDAAAGTNDGTWYGNPTLGVPGSNPGDPATAAQFNGNTNYGSVTRQIQDDCSIELWFKSTQGLSTSTNWYNGAGMVDAEVAGVTNDFGVSLLANGRIAAGTGNPDTTLLSNPGFNDGNWHQVVFTRIRSTGALTLYVDGASVATGTGGKNSLTAPANINFGRTQTGINYYQGSLDGVALYTTALSASTVLSHYQANGR